MKIILRDAPKFQKQLFLSVCAAGFYGDLPSPGCTACPIGSWNNETGQTSIESCRNCTGGKTTDNNATTSEDMCGRLNQYFHITNLRFILVQKCSRRSFF